MISILLPARGRPEGIKNAISSLLMLAKTPEYVEVLVRLDKDDPQLNTILQVLNKFPCVNHDDIIIGDRGKGYRDVFHYYNRLASMCRGDRMINWNDDVQMLTQHWDSLLNDCPPHSIQFMRRDILEHADTTFPVTGRSVYKAMGRLAGQVHADDWLGYVAKGAEVAVFRDDVVFHHDRLIDQTSYDRDHGGYDTEGFNAPEMVAERAKDIEKVKAAKPHA